MTGNTVLLVVGTGSLARATCAALAQLATAPTEVVVVGRGADRAAEVCYLAGTRAALADRAVAFRPVAADLDDTTALTGLVRGTAPDGVLLCASPQSPWERLTAPSAWTDLLAAAGFGLTLPLQADLAHRLGRALALGAPRAWYLNACFPDAVNPLLATLGIAPLCGIGNVGLLAASLRAALGPAGPRPLRVLAHHAHLHRPESDVDEALAWLGDEPVAGVGALLAAQRAAPRPELNAITGHTAALLVDHLLTGRPALASVPGPLGLPGGYPVRVAAGGLELDLPAGWTRDRAVAVNQRAAARDGVTVHPDRVEFAPAACDALRTHLPDLADGFAPGDLDRRTEQLLALRERLRARPTAHPAPHPAHRRTP